MGHHDHQTNGKARIWPVPCPVCGEPLLFGYLEIPEDDGSVGKLLTYDYPNNDYHGAMQEAEVRQIFTHEAVRRMQLLKAYG